MTNEEKARELAEDWKRTYWVYEKCGGTGEDDSFEECYEAAKEMAEYKDKQIPEIMLKYTEWMAKRGFFAEDLCVDFEHQIKTFLEQIYPESN